MVDVVVREDGDCKVGIGLRSLDCLKGRVRKLKFYLSDNQEPSRGWVRQSKSQNKLNLKRQVPPGNGQRDTVLAVVIL